MVLIKSEYKRNEELNIGISVVIGKLRENDWNTIQSTYNPVCCSPCQVYQMYNFIILEDVLGLGRYEI